jgi:hypothetical protein
MRIKKHENGNEYLLTESGVWVRNFTLEVAPIDINNVTNRDDYGSIAENEIKNNNLEMSEIDTDKIHHNSAIIVSDGFDFVSKQHLLSKIPDNVIVIATNRSLAKWKVNRKIDYFLVNNPYSECMLQMPKHRYFPPCVASSRTYHEFLKEYDKKEGAIYKYSSVREKGFSPSNNKELCVIDDYRNPVCAALGLVYKLGVSKVMLFCCDNAFAEERPGAEQLPNGKWIYPAQRIGHSIIDGMLYWYSKIPKSKFCDHSSGPEYKYAHYITEEDISNFYEI